jgi:electron transport complex protein RnfD
MSILTVSPSPHTQTEQTVPKLMYGVIIALLPAFAVSVFYFGIGMLIITAVSIVSCVIFEFLFQKYLLKTKPSHLDGSAALTGILLAFCLPANLPVWMVIIGALVSIGIAKMTFGGLGNNIFNPAIVGRVFLFISFPAAMTSYPEPGQWWRYLDATTGATPLSKMKESLANNMGLDEIMPSMPSNMDMFMGRMLGSAGEVAAFALLIGLVYMLWKKIISWHIPVSIFLSVIIFAGVLNMANPDKFPTVLFQLLSGGLILGAAFMATDYVTSPMAPRGMIIYGVGIGVITILIRSFGAYPEGVQFAILLMNGFTPLINKYVKPKRFGEVKHG